MLDSQSQVLAAAHQQVLFFCQVLDLQFDFVNLVELPSEPEIDVIRLGGGLGDYLCHLTPPGARRTRTACRQGPFLRTCRPCSSAGRLWSGVGGSELPGSY